MSTAVARPLPTTVEAPPTRRLPLGVRVRRAILPAFTALVVAYLFLPIVVMILFGFNDIEGRFNYAWQGFTIDHWANIFNRFPALNEAIKISLIIAGISTVIATALGTLIGLALTRYEFRGRSGLNLLIFLPIATPEIILGASLLAMFATLAISRGMLTILIAHIMFNISFVVVTIRARLTGFNRSLEEAAMDLGADEFTTFRKVTFPLILPGIMAAALLAFALSIDDFVITQFTAGQTATFPLWVYGASRLGIPPQVNVVGSLIFFIALVAIGIWIMATRRSIARSSAA